MTKVYNPIFTINIASKPKNKISDTSINRRISRKCLAVVIKDDKGNISAAVNYDKKEFKLDDKSIIKDILVVPFTEESLNLKDKLYVFQKEKDNNNHIVCVIRSKDKAHRFPGTDRQYDALKENLLIAGHIIRKNGKMYFEYEDIIAYHYLSEHHIQEVNINEDKPLFTK